jgi:hypothetical protein
LEVSLAPAAPGSFYAQFSAAPLMARTNSPDAASVSHTAPVRPQHTVRPALGPPAHGRATHAQHAGNIRWHPRPARQRFETMLAAEAPKWVDRQYPSDISGPFPAAIPTLIRRTSPASCEEDISAMPGIPCAAFRRCDLCPASSAERRKRARSAGERSTGQRR